MSIIVRKKKDSKAINPVPHIFNDEEIQEISTEDADINMDLLVKKMKVLDIKAQRAKEKHLKYLAKKTAIKNVLEQKSTENEYEEMFWKTARARDRVGKPMCLYIYTSKNRACFKELERSSQMVCTNHSPPPWLRRCIRLYKEEIDRQQLQTEMLFLQASKQEESSSSEEVDILGFETEDEEDDDLTVGALCLDGPSKTQDELIREIEKSTKIEEISEFDALSSGESEPEDGEIILPELPIEINPLPKGLKKKEDVDTFLNWTREERGLKYWIDNHPDLFFGDVLSLIKYLDEYQSDLSYEMKFFSSNYHLIHPIICRLLDS